jgi:hypothetical protein
MTSLRAMVQLLRVNRFGQSSTAHREPNRAYNKVVGLIILSSSARLLVSRAN